MNSVIAAPDRPAGPVGPEPYQQWRERIAAPVVPSLAPDRRTAFRRDLLRLLAEPFTRRSIAERQYALTGFLLAVPAFVLVADAFAISLSLSMSFAGMLLGLPLLAVSLCGARRLGALHRALAAGLLGLQVPAPPARPRRRGVLGWFRESLCDPAGWRAVAYLLVRLPILAFGGFIVATFWVYGLPFLTFPLWWGILHAAGASGSAIHLTPWLSHWWNPVADAVSIRSLALSFSLVPLGAALVLTSPWKVRAVAIADGALINALLAPGSLPQRVRHLERTRAQAVDDAAAQLQQIERDLHDGAQAQMVAVAMKLGLAREKLGTAGARAEADLERALQLVDDAHASAREAIIELRDLARGIHPPVLDGGLVTALATLAARSAVPVELVADLPERPSAGIETIAYFCAAELLANIAKHSDARHATLEVVHVPGLLRVRVSDDGSGGAQVRPGGGLAGLAERLRTVDGTLQVSSPPGGPTVATIEMPSPA
ncbi:MAG TPA: sensor domain-containing protein [Streptosporangiaceae bacterium]|jgi:signal transduction histidine kinase